MVRCCGECGGNPEPKETGADNELADGSPEPTATRVLADLAPTRVFVELGERRPNRAGDPALPTAAAKIAIRAA